MSTEFQILPDPAVERTDYPALEISESSSCFSIMAIGNVCWTVGSSGIQGFISRQQPLVIDLGVNLTADELVDMALRLMQPAFYNLADADAAKARIIAAVNEMYPW
jgi:hypothetical protein